MYYFYQCPKCGKYIVEWENAQEAEYDAFQKLIDATKEHFEKWHYPNELIWTDEELKYKIQSEMQQSQEAPVD